MQRLVAGTAVTITVPFVDDDGNDIVPTALSYRVLDENEVEAQPETALPAPAGGATSVVVVVPASANALPAPSPNLNGGSAPNVVALRALREVELTMTTAAGLVTARAAYVITAPTSPLVVLQNSFQTYNQAVLVADGAPGVDGFASASTLDRVNALAEAFRRLTRIGYRVQWPHDPDSQSYLGYPRDTRDIAPRMWPLMSLDQFMQYYPENFRQALRLAQVLEADTILTPDAYADRRSAGVIQEVIGQSSVTFRSSRALTMGVNDRTFDALKGFVLFRLTTTRS